MNNNYLIPANSKKSIMIFGMFYKFDLLLFGCGIAATLIMIWLLPVADIKVAIISIAPAAITGFLVFPVPHYHNVLTVIISTWRFFTTRQKFVWKGWCVTSEFKEDKK